MDSWQGLPDACEPVSWLREKWLRIRGGMCTIFEARQLFMDRPGSLKVPHNWLLTDSAALQRFRREAIAVSALDRLELSEPEEIRSVSIDKSSGSTFFDLSALDAISNASPFCGPLNTKTDRTVSGRESLRRPL